MIGDALEAAVGDGLERVGEAAIVEKAARDLYVASVNVQLCRRVHCVVER
jgi:hypothetical protein